jgi:hypothetical protein
MAAQETLLICLNLSIMGTTLFYITYGLMQQRSQGKYEFAFINRHRDTIRGLGGKL